MFAGYLLSLCKKDPDFNRATCVVIGEAHERSRNTDLLMSMLKEAVRKRREAGNPLKVVIMSATLNVGQFARFFGTDNIIDIPGVTHPVKTYRLSEPSTDPVVSAIDTVVDYLHPLKPSGDVLVFVPGQADITKFKRGVSDRLKDREQNQNAILCIGASASISDMERQQIDEDPPILADGELVRKVIVATNVAETSLTIPGLKYVVDTGLVKMKTYDPISDKSYLASVPISKANARQRKGRVGRVEPGECYCMYTDMQFAQFAEQPPAEILRESMTETLVTLLHHGRDPYTFDWIQPPSPSILARAVEELTVLRVIEKGNLKLTKDIGEYVAKAPLPPHRAVALIGATAKAARCTTELCAIFAMMQVTETRSVWLPRPQESEAGGKWDAAKQSMTHWTGDHISLLMIFENWQHAKANLSLRNQAQWCKERYLYQTVLKQADTMYNKLLDVMVDRMKLSVRTLDYTDPLWITRIWRGLCAGYYSRTALQIHGNHYQRLAQPDDVEVNHHTTTLLGTDFLLKWVIYDSVTQNGSKTHMNFVTAVPLEILFCACPEFFDAFRLPDGNIQPKPKKDDKVSHPRNPKEALLQQLAEMTGLDIDSLRGARLEQIEQSCRARLEQREHST